MKKLFILIIVCTVTTALWAQGASHSDKNILGDGPDLQTTDKSFFNPDANLEEAYKFHMEYRIEAGYLQNWQHGKDSTSSRIYLHGARLGATFDFMLPHRLSIQTGLLYSIAYGRSQQKWGVVDEEESYAASDSVIHRITEHWLAVPIRVYYNIKLWKKLNLFFFAGPQLMIGLAEIDNIDNQLPPKATQYYTSQGVQLERYNRFSHELYPVNIQLGLGGGLEWDCFRLQAGYDFGLNNQYKQKQIEGQFMWEWSWFVSFAYKLPVK